MAKLDLNLEVEIPKRIVEYLELVRNAVRIACEDCRRCGKWDEVLKKVKFPLPEPEPVQSDEKGPSRHQAAEKVKAVDKPIA